MSESGLKFQEFLRPEPKQSLGRWARVDVDEIDIRHPDEVIGLLGEEAELLFRFLQRFLRPLALGDIRSKRQRAGDFSIEDERAVSLHEEYCLVPLPLSRKHGSQRCQ